MNLIRIISVFLYSGLCIAGQAITPNTLQGTITNIHYIIWDQSATTPDTVFIQLNNNKEYRFDIYDSLPLQRGQQVLIQLPVIALRQEQNIQPACGITPLGDKGTVLNPLKLRPSNNCR